MAPLTVPVYLTGSAREGYQTGLDVLAGRMAVEDAGDVWLSHADRSHSAGVNFDRGYALSGAPR